ncbi:leucine-rich repeat isoform f [Anaeramoeba flamelloides]|uniref:Leucine-rich repeat isoform f n=1 Tax=Anaeramoeba flamelloides TaxID=1746091 RepID=A0AAV7YPB3_9EUKA|nr:leucine-rich repeat isoform f [Anaeramoeba flamelloides]
MNNSIKRALTNYMEQKKENVLKKCVVKKKKRLKAIETILVITNYKIFLFRLKNDNLLLKHEMVILEITNIKSIDCLHIIIKSKTETIKLITSEVNEIIFLLQKQYSFLTANNTQFQFLDLDIGPKKRKKEIKEKITDENRLIRKEMDPLLQYTELYKAYCQLYKSTLNNDVINFIYQTQPDPQVESQESSYPILNLNLLKNINITSNNDSNFVKIEPIFLALNYNSHFKGLTLTKTNRKDVIPLLVELMKVNTTLERVVFQTNYQNDFLKKFANSLLENKKNQINYLDFSDCKPTTKSLQSFLKILGKTNSIKSTQSVKTLKKLDISNGKLSAKGSKDFCDLLDEISNAEGILSHISLSSTELDDHKILSKINNDLTMGVKKLNLSNNSLDYISFDQIINIINNSNKFRKLNLSNTNLTQGYLIKIVKTIILKKESAKKFCLNISSNQLNTESARLLSELLKENPNIFKKLIFNDNNFGGEGIKNLLESLALNKTIEELSIGGNTSPKEDIQGLIPIFRSFLNENNKLKKIDLSGNNKKYFGNNFSHFLKEIRKNNTLEYLDINNNDLNADELSLIFSYIKNNEKINSLYFNNNNQSYQTIVDFKHLVVLNKNIFNSTIETKNIKINLDTTVRNNLKQLKKDIGNLLLTNKLKYQISQNSQSKINLNLKKNTNNVQKSHKIIMSQDKKVLNNQDKTTNEDIVNKNEDKSDDSTTSDDENFDEDEEEEEDEDEDEYEDEDGGSESSTESELSDENNIEDNFVKVNRKLLNELKFNNATEMADKIELGKMSNSLKAIIERGNYSKLEKWIRDDSEHNINVKDIETGKTIVHLACEKGHANILSLLLRHGGEKLINVVDDKGLTPLHALLVTSRNKDCLKLLLDLGVKVNIADHRHRTPLIFMIENLEKLARDEQIALVQYCIKKRFNPFIKYRMSLIQVALKHYCSAIIPLLIKIGVGVDSKDSVGDTALHNAVLWKNFDTVCLLLKYNADPFITDSSNKSPYVIAKNINYVKAIDLLKIEDHKDMENSKLIIKKKSISHLELYQGIRKFKTYNERRRNFINNSYKTLQTENDNKITKIRKNREKNIRRKYTNKMLINIEKNKMIDLDKVLKDVKYRFWFDIYLQEINLDIILKFYIRSHELKEIKPKEKKMFYFGVKTLFDDFFSMKNILFDLIEETWRLSVHNMIIKKNVQQDFFIEGIYSIKSSLKEYFINFKKTEYYTTMLEIYYQK